MELTRDQVVEKLSAIMSYVDGYYLGGEGGIEREEIALLAHDTALRTRLAACEADKVKAEARVQALEQDNARLREVLVWLVNLLHGVSKGAGDGFHHGITDEEWRDAIDAAQHALEGSRAACTMKNK